ncbi:TonB-dependent receptor [Labilibaculum euxinus]
MRTLPAIVVIILLCLSTPLRAQEKFLEGEISYKSSQNTYAKFSNTESISVGDTLYVKKDSDFVPVLVVNNKSSISVIGMAVGDIKLAKGDKIIAFPTAKKTPEKDIILTEDPEYNTEIVEKTTPAPRTKQELNREEQIRGKISASSYSNLSSSSGGSNHRMRYSLSMNAKNIDNSKFSAETYIRFSHNSGEWDEVKSDIFNALKIYNLAICYDANQSTSIWLGRKINRKVSNIGAVDGVQVEKKIGNFSLGAIAGSRPDYENYSFNFDLMQFGGYLEHSMKTKVGSMQNTVSFFEQKYKSNTDRRFAYYQHSNSLLKNLFLFASFEVDLYKLEEEVSKNTFDLTSMYLSLRYRVSKQLSLTGSLDRRKNVVYYETFKSLDFQILENETRQGIRFRVNYRPTNRISMGANVGHRSRKSEVEDSKNLYAFVSYRNVPGINSNATLSTSVLQTHYLDGIIYKLRLTRDIIPGKLFAGLNYSYVNYQYKFNNNELIQHIGEANISWRINKKLSFSANYEGTFESSQNYSRLYLNLIKRF